MRIEKRKIQWRAAAFFLGLAMCSGCGLTPRERTVLLPDLSTENYGDLEQMLTLSWNTDVPVFSTGFRQENGKAYLYTAVTENQEIYIRQYDVVYGFYQDIFRLPTSNCFGIWISPDGTEAACLSDDSGYNLSLSIYNLSDGSCTVLAEYLYDVQVDGVWSADASSFLGWSAEMPDGRHQAQCWYYKRQGNITTPLTIDLVRGDSFLLHGALSWNGGLGLIEGLSYDAIENGDVDVIEIPGNQIDKAEDSSGQLITFSDDSTWGLCLNLQDDVLKHKDARALFIKTLNRENLLQYWPAHSRHADDILSPAATWNGESYRELEGDGFYVQQDDAILATLSSVLEELDLTSMPSLTVLGPDTDNMKLLLNEMLVVWNGRLGNYFNKK